MSKRILVVEDQDDNMQILRDLLGSVDYEIIEARDGAEGVTSAKRTPRFLPEPTTATLVSEVGGGMAGKPALFAKEIGAGCGAATS